MAAKVRVVSSAILACLTMMWRIAAEAVSGLNGIVMRTNTYLVRRPAVSQVTALLDLMPHPGT